MTFSKRAEPSIITRRNCIIGASAALICAPAVVRAGNLMAIRGVIMPVQRNYYGFVDRLWIDHRYRSGELQGRDLIHVNEQGVLRHIPPAGRRGSVETLLM
jgi:hypothetical protein